MCSLFVFLPFTSLQFFPLRSLSQSIFYVICTFVMFVLFFCLSLMFTLKVLLLLLHFRLFPFPPILPSLRLSILQALHLLAIPHFVSHYYPFFRILLPFLILLDTHTHTHKFTWCGSELPVIASKRPPPYISST